MKKFLFACAAAMLTFSSASAQSDKYLFNHLSAGVSAGTNGIGIDVATTCTEYLQVRAGVSFCPSIKPSVDIELNQSEVNAGIAQANEAIAKANAMAGLRINPLKSLDCNEITVEGNIEFTTGKVLVDIFPFKHTKVPFFVTVGAYFGTSEIVSAYNKDKGSLQFVNDVNNTIREYNANLGKINQFHPTQPLSPREEVCAKLGDYRLGPDENGDMMASIKVKSFRPYLGIGFGRPVPKNKRVGCMVELGCQFHGTPEVSCNNTVLDPANAGGDGGDIIKIISKVNVYPCINVRLCGKIF